MWTRGNFVTGLDYFLCIWTLCSQRISAAIKPMMLVIALTQSVLVELGLHRTRFFLVPLMLVLFPMLVDITLVMPFQTSRHVRCATSYVSHSSWAMSARCFYTIHLSLSVIIIVDCETEVFAHSGLTWWGRVFTLMSVCGRCDHEFTGHVVLCWSCSSGFETNRDTNKFWTWSRWFRKASTRHFQYGYMHHYTRNVLQVQDLISLLTCGPFSLVRVLINHHVKHWSPLCWFNDCFTYFSVITDADLSFNTLIHMLPVRHIWDNVFKSRTCSCLSET